VVATYAANGSFAGSSSTPAKSFSISKDTTTTKVSLSPTTVLYGNESASIFTITVTTHNGEAVPNGEKATVLLGAATCTVTLSSGQGTCTIANTALVASSYGVFGIYMGDANLSGSIALSSTKLAVNKDTTSAAVSESPATVTRGHESASVFTVTVTTHNGEAVPNGEKVTVHIGSTTCTVTLSNGTGTCTISNSALAVGSYVVSATYGGDTNLSGSTASNASKLTVHS